MILLFQDPSTNKKYFRRGELLAKEQAEYMLKYGPKVEENKQTDVKDVPEKGLKVYFI